MDTEALPAALAQHPLMPRAVEELKVLTQSDLERERYEARRKAQLDHNSYLRELEKASRKAQEEGLAAGEKIGMIHAFERVLNIPQTSTEQLIGLTLDELARRADELQAQLPKPH